MIARISPGRLHKHTSNRLVLMARAVLSAKQTRILRPSPQHDRAYNSSIHLPSVECEGSLSLSHQTCDVAASTEFWAWGLELREIEPRGSAHFMGELTNPSGWDSDCKTWYENEFDQTSLTHPFK